MKSYIRPFPDSGILFFLLFFAFLFIGSCAKDDPSLLSQLGQHPKWSKSANIYEVNIRQYTPEGTFAAFQKDLPRLKEMGVDILWLMPIHPIGEENRKGTLGSYYSIRDYRAVNPSFGTMEDFRNLVGEAIYALIVGGIAMGIAAFMMVFVDDIDEEKALTQVSPEPEIAV